MPPPLPSQYAMPDRRHLAHMYGPSDPYSQRHYPAESHAVPPNQPHGQHGWHGQQQPPQPQQPFRLPPINAILPPGIPGSSAPMPGAYDAQQPHQPVRHSWSDPALSHIGPPRHSAQGQYHPQLRDQGGYRQQQFASQQYMPQQPAHGYVPQQPRQGDSVGSSGHGYVHDDATPLPAPSPALPLQPPFQSGPTYRR
ncbi:hypothetical protein BC831DRAFT_451235 [Entophlyctis helioformis]|nr:hypothetical protein BC831DRAFT_451235 [Entophlyctis helioformis]